jgi:hypothetical protein
MGHDPGPHSTQSFDGCSDDVMDEAEDVADDVVAQDDFEE